MCRRTILFLLAALLIAPHQSARGQREWPAGEPVRLPAVENEVLAASDPSLPLTFDAAEAIANEPADDITMDAVRQEIRRLSWTVGDFKLVPYGYFWSDMIYSTARVRPGSFTLFVESRENDGEPTFVIDARRSRFGFDLQGPGFLWPEGESGGKLEIDFLGDFVTENRASVRLRHAYWELKNPYARLLVGQTWDVISPLIPGTINAGFGYNAGNIGFRRAQFRAERYLHLSDELLVTMQGSLNQDIISDFPTDPGVVREPVNWPVIEARTAVTLHPHNGDLATTLGVSGHIGEVGFHFVEAGPPPLNLPPLNDARFQTWSLNVDMRAPINERCGFQGELFMGANLSPFLGGIGQGVCPCLRVPIRSRGGWCEFWFDWTPCVHSHVGGGLDDPIDRDSLLGRVYNQFIFANVTFDITDRLLTGLEVSAWKTLYHDTRAGQIPPDQLTPSQPGNAIVVDWMVRYGF